MVAAPVVQLANFSETFSLVEKTTPTKDRFIGLVKVEVSTVPPESGDGEIDLPDGVTITDASDGSSIKFSLGGAYGPALSTGEDVIVVGSFDENDVLIPTRYSTFEDAISATYDKAIEVNFYTWATKTYTYTVQYQLWDPDMPPPLGDYLDPVNINITQLVAPNYGSNEPRIKAIIANQKG